MELTGCCKLRSGASGAVAEGSSAVSEVPCVLREVCGWEETEHGEKKERKMVLDL